MFVPITGAVALSACLLATAVPAGVAVAVPAGGDPRGNAPCSAPVAPEVAPQTLENLRTAMRGEAFANASYTFFGAQADREGLRIVGDLYRRTAAVELNEHFREEAALAGVVGDDVANLTAAIEGEMEEATTMYPAFAEQAAADGDPEAAALFTEIAGDERAHADAFRAALRAIQEGVGAIPPPPAVDPVSVPAGGPRVRSPRTLANLDTAMHGEALAHARYTLFAERAARCGDEALAVLFAGAASVELREHLAGEAVLFGLVRETRENLAASIAGERYEAEVMYPGFADQAYAAGDTRAAATFLDDARDEAGHARAFQRALDDLG